MMSVPQSVMKCIQWYKCLPVPAEREQSHFMSRSTLELEVTSLPKLDQPRWPAQWPGSCQHQANCIQWIPYTSIWHTSWPHHLVARWPQHLTLQGKLLLVHCRHPQSCHPRTSIMQKVSSCEDELQHHSCPT